MTVAIVRARRRASVLVAVALLAAPAPTATAAEAPFCHVMDVSPAFASDRTAFCGYAATSTLVVYRTRDAGRTWSRVAKTVVRIPDGSRVTQLVVSADYPNDRTVYVMTNSDLYASDDDGETFLPLDVLAGDGSGRRVFTRYLDVTGGAVPYVAFAAYQEPARLRPPAHQAVTAALPEKTDRFLIPARVTPTTVPLVVTFSGSGGNLTRSVFACNAALACPTRRGTIPGPSDVMGAWLSPTYERDRTLYVATNRGGFTFYRSTDAGASFHPWASLNAALRVVTTEMVRLGIPAYAPPALAFGPARRVYVRVAPGVVGEAGKTPPSQLLLRSDDGGARWKQVAASYPGGDRRRSTLPFDPDGYTTPENSVAITATTDGRLFASGADRRTGDFGPWCSVDGGVRWARTCPR